MTKTILTIIALLITSSCNPAQPDFTEIEASKMQEENKEEVIKCHRIRKYPILFRCENEEVICYSGGNRQGISCKWKLI